MKKKSFILYCFSPMVMIATCTVEISAACYTIFKYRMTRTAQLITAMLGFLALFQLAEYMVCVGAFMISSLDWARLGYAAITILPPLGVHMGLTIAEKKNTPLLVGAYASAAIFMIFFLFVGHGMQSQVCLGNYVIFTIAPYATIPYGVYYYGWLVTGTLLAWHGRNAIKNKDHQKALFWLVCGYLSFMLPTLIVNLMDHETMRGIPSIMCGFAILMALTLLFKVSPLLLKDKNISEKAIEPVTK